MPKNVVITPLSGLVDFYDLNSNLDAKIQIDDAGSLSITNTGGTLSLGNTAANVIVGDGVNSVDMIFEQNGAIRGATGRTLTLGSSGSNVTIASPLTINSPIVNTTTTGEFEVRQTVTSWTNSTSHPLIKWTWNATYDDNLYLSSGGNAAGTSQTALVISETNGILIGKASATPNATSVLSSAVTTINSSNGNFTTAGSIVTTGSNYRVSISTDSGGSLSLGRIDNVASSPYIDFNTGATTVDFDVRLAATGGTGSSGGGTLTVSGNLSITGNLTINGTTTTVNSTTVTVDDPIFTLGGDTAPTVDDNKDRGIEFRWHNGTSAKVGFFGYDDSTGYLTFIPDATNTSEVFSGTQGDIQATNFRGALVGNASTASAWQNARTLTIGSTGKSVDGSAAVSWSLGEIGAPALSGLSTFTGTGSFRAFSLRTSDASGNNWSWFAMGGTSDSAGNVWHVATNGTTQDIGNAGAFHIRGNNGATSSVIINQDHSVRFRSSNVFLGATTNTDGVQVVTNSGSWGISVTGTAANVTGTVAIAKGGTGATTAQGAINALAGAVTAAQYLRGNGTNVVMSAIQAADVPTLNQNTTGSAGSVANSATFNNAGSGAASGTTFNGSAAVTISHNTIGATQRSSITTNPESSVRSADIRTLTNPTTGLGYFGGVRFRFSSLNDDNNAPYADVFELSTYTDSSGGGFNALYFGKNSQTIQHKYAAAGGTSWTAKTLAYTDTTIFIGTSSFALNRASASQTLNGVSIDGNAGTVTNGVYTNGSYANPAWITSLSETKVLPSQATHSGKFLTTNGTSTSWSTVSGGINYTRVTSNTTLVDKQGVIADTSGGTFTVTLPATPTTGVQVSIVDGASWSTTNLTVARNGSTIEGLAEDLILDIGGAKVDLIYDGTTWEVYCQAGVGGTAIDLNSTQTLTNKTINFSNNTLTGVASTSTTQTLTNKTLTSPTITSATITSPVTTDIKVTGLRETTTVSATAATGTINYDYNTQSVLYYTTNASGNFTINVRGDSGTTLNSKLGVGESVTVVFMNTNGSTAYYHTGFQVDGTSVTPKWQGGTAPSSGNTSSIDIYTYTIIKTASTPSYTVLASQTKFA